MIRKILQPFYTAYAILVFAVLFLVLFLPVVLISAGNSSRSRKCIWQLLRLGARLLLLLFFMPMKVIGRVPRGRYVIVANHISYLDAVVLFPVIGSYWRALGKKEMSKIPLFGFVYKQIVVMVDRSSGHSRARSMRLMWRVLRHESSIAIFPEGTFNETGAPLKSFYDGAFRLAINSGVPIVPVVFPDTVQRWHYSGWWKIWPGRNRASVLPEVPVDGLSLKDLPVLKEKVAGMMAEELVRLGHHDPRF